jgi:hypothetical protein
MFAVIPLGVVFLSAGCVAPASSTTDYQGKAGHTAAAALSQLETARLAVETAKRGNLLHATLKIVLSQAEDGFTSIQATFDSIQPPNSDEADKVRDKLDQILSDGADGLGQLRIAARRNDSAQMNQVSADLAKVSQQLQALSDEPSA